MKNKLIHDINVEIIKSFNRYVTITIIVALGVGFLTGIKATSPAMKYTADSYFDRQNYSDIRLVSTGGFTDSDLQELEKTEGIQKITASYCADTYVNTVKGVKTVRIHALGDPQNGMNLPDLIEGKWPKKPGECLVDSKQKGIIGELGSKISVSDKNSQQIRDLFACSEYTITGFINSPEYINYANRGSISIGDGSIYCFVYIPAGDFKSEVYTDLLVKADGAQSLSCYSDAYEDLVDGIAQKIKDLSASREDARLSEIKDEANQNLTKAVSELKDARQDYDAQSSDALRKINDSAEEIDRSQKEIDQQQQSLSDAKKAFDLAKSDFETKSRELKAELASAKTKIENQKNTYNDSKQQLDQGYADLNAVKDQQKALQASGQTNDAALLQIQIDEKAKELTAAQSSLDAMLTAINSAELAYTDQSKQYTSFVESTSQELKTKETELSGAESQLSTATSELGKAKTKLSEAQTAYDDAKREAETSFADAQDKIDGLRQQIADLEKPEWLVMTRNDNLDYANFRSDANRIDALSLVIPIFFYLIAALVCLTTISRMVEEQRTQMGVLRALGFTKGAITSKYLIYAGSASIIGCALGLLMGRFLLPYLIFRSYGAMYTVPSLQVPFNLSYTLTASLVAILINTLTALSVCYFEAASVPAQLIRPKAPPPGHRVLLERIPLIWGHISFMLKVMFRNLFRFKKRFFMTVLGIAGCTALLLAGFGLRDSIAGTVPSQYYGLHSYHLFINLSYAGSAADVSDLNQSLETLVSNSLYITQNKVSVQGLDPSIVTYLFVPEEVTKAAAFINFRDPKNKAPLEFPQPGKVILTEKIASELNLKAGDKITFSQDETRSAELEVGGITENYIYNYIFMDPQDYVTAFGTEPEYKMVLGIVENGASITQAEEKELTTELLKSKNVVSATTIASIRREFDNAMKNLNAVVLIIIVCACLLNFVVLYNLTNINITERIREIASIKVLGFLNHEVSDYINREIVALTLIGILVGLVGGVFLHSFTIRTAEVELVMFVRQIKPMSYLWSVLLTVVFSVLINLTVQYRLRKVKMVESLKSVE